MKKNVLKIVAAFSIAAFGVCAFASVNQKASRVEATPHTSNFEAYTYSGTYYSSLSSSLTEGLNGTLRKALSTLIFPKGWYTYSSAGNDHLSTQLQYADEDPTNNENMIYLYTRDSVKKNAASSWNREHVWPQSNSEGHWGTDKAGTDILHIRPTYNTTNSTRGNLKYGNMSSGETVEYNGITYGKRGSYFEPIDAVKGDVARIIMYVWTAYYDYYNDSDLTITDTFASYNTLLEWHTLDKPDALEGLRNDYSQTSIQKNRNPFVDHPEYAWKVFGNEASDSIKEACIAAYPAEGSSQTTTKKLTSISISGNATNKAYFSGDSFDATGLTVNGIYDDGSSEVIPNNNCVWTPNPLTEGTTSVTCTYSGKTAIYQGITVSKKEINGNTFSVSFVASGTDSGTDYSTQLSTISSELVSDNTLIKSFDSGQKVFAGKDGLKLGSNSANGEIKFTLLENARENIKSITIESSRYGSDANTLILKLDNSTITSDITPGTDYQKSFNNISASSMTISTSTKRAYLNKITVVIADTTPIEPGPNSSSSQPISSSEEVPSSSSSSIQESSSIPEESSSLPEESSSGEIISSEISEFTSSDISESSIEPIISESSSEIESVSSNKVSSTSEESTSMIEEQSSSIVSESSEDISTSEMPSSENQEPSEISSSNEPTSTIEEQSSSAVLESSEDVSSNIEQESSVSSSEESATISSADNSSATTTPSSNNNQTKKRGGCSGSLLASASITGFTSLIGLVFVLLKKKR